MPKVTAWTLFLPDFMGATHSSCPRSCPPQQKKATCAQRVTAFPVTMVTGAEEMVVGFGQNLVAHLSIRSESSNDIIETRTPSSSFPLPILFSRSALSPVTRSRFCYIETETPNWQCF